jgi:cell pole-organizing protein PopZ
MADTEESGERRFDAQEESLAFSDTFSASDVYHEDPPALDEDYSASLDSAQPDPVPRADLADGPEGDDGMERVGGLVRDAMERDPVDYADPSALVSMTSEELSARALASLADVEGEASRRMYASMRVGEDKESESIEGMVKSMLRPMLREWLDDNLPDMVETMVRGEVERISAKSRKYSRTARED